MIEHGEEPRAGTAVAWQYTGVRRLIGHIVVTLALIALVVATALVVV